MLDKEFQYYLANKNALSKKYDGKFVVIVGEEIVGVYDAEIEAYLESKTKFELGTFLIQEVSSDDSTHTEIFHSRVSI